MPVPDLPTEEQYIAGRWTAKLVATGAFGGIDVTQVPVWLVQRHLATASPIPAESTESLVLLVRFVLVSPPNRQAINVSLLGNAISSARDSLFKATGMHLEEPAGTRPVVATAEQYTTDLYSAQWTQLVQTYATPDRVTVFALANLASPPVPTAESAVGFAMIPGPQGFTVAHSVVAVRVKSDLTESAGKIGTRILHELSHYLGTVHESACLDAMVTGSNLDVCRAAVAPVIGAPNADAIRANTMFTVLPGGRYNTEQAYQLKRSPIVTRTVTLPASKTPVTSLWVRVHTGLGFRGVSDFFRGDGPGTDDKVYFALDRSTGRSVTQEVGTIWNDFEAGVQHWYQLNPGIEELLFEEDITDFTISKSYDPGAHMGLFGDDHWHLQGLEIQINGREWFNDDNLNTWLVNDDSGPWDLSRPLHRPAREALATAGSPPTGASATPPFADYPVALRFGPIATAGVSPGAWSSLAVAGPAFGWQAAWVRPTDLSTEQAILTAGDSTTGLLLRIRAGHYEAVVFNAGTAVVASGLIPAVDKGTWVHLYAGCDGTTLTLIRNSLVVGMTASGGVTGLAGQLIIGAGGFTGQIREACLWTGARTTDQVAVAMFGIQQGDPALVGYWPMDEGDGDVCFDYSGFGDDARITNATWAIPSPDLPNALFLPETQRRAARSSRFQAARSSRPGSTQGSPSPRG